MVKNTKFNPNLYYIGVNAGTLGFLQEIDINECKDFIERLNENNYKLEKISVAEVKIITKNKTYAYSFLNEIAIRALDYDILKLPVYVDQELLENFAGDGLLISTPTGSTAYSLSSGGCIIYNTLNALSITSIAPVNNKVSKTLRNSIVIPNNKKVTLIPRSEQKDLFVIIDGVNKKIEDIQKIEVVVDKKYITCLRMKEFHFVKVLNDKILG